MHAREIGERVYWVGAVDWTRRIFDELIPVPDGTSYNAYLVRGSERTVLIDTVEPDFAETLLGRLEALDVTSLDFIVANHAEQDHSGSLPLLLERFPKAQVLCTPKAQDMLQDLLGLPPERFQVVEDGATVSLGDRTLEFLHAPWVHWPETMLTYLPEEQILFPCDLFGSHLATSELVGLGAEQVYEPAKRYYAEIMMPFRKKIAAHLERLGKKEIRMIAPSHGPVHESPAWILAAYNDWVSGKPKNKVVLPYVSMHGSTRQLVMHLIDALTDRGVHVEPFDLAVTDEGKLAMALVDAATLVIGTSTVLAGAHPRAVYAAYLASVIRPKVRYAAVVGSFGWGGRVVTQLQGLMGAIKAEWLEPVLCKGRPGDEDLAALERLADTIHEGHRELGLVDDQN